MVWCIHYTCSISSSSLLSFTTRVNFSRFRATTVGLSLSNPLLLSSNLLSMTRWTVVINQPKGQRVKRSSMHMYIFSPGFQIYFRTALDRWILFSFSHLFPFNLLFIKLFRWAVSSLSSPNGFFFYSQKRLKAKGSNFVLSSSGLTCWNEKDYCLNPASHNSDYKLIPIDRQSLLL